MNIKISLIVWIVAAIIASPVDGRRGRFRKGSKLWCKVFETETVESGETVGDFCKQMGIEIWDFLTEKRDTMKQTITSVCQDGEFGDETMKGQICARVLSPAHVGRYGTGSKLWCKVFETETVESGETVGDFCKQIGTDIWEFLTEKKNTMKQSITNLCLWKLNHRDFGEETMKGKMCASLLGIN
jgi:hypothetical protein